MVISSARIKQAIVAAMRAETALKTAVNGFHDSFAPADTDYPFVTYQRISAPYDYDWTSVTLRTYWDIKVWSRSPVEAEDLDLLVTSVLNDASLSVSEQSTLICRRYSDLGDRDIDEEGKAIYMAGGTYTVWTSQPLATTESRSFAADALLS
jgi:hypothetical protein